MKFTYGINKITIEYESTDTIREKRYVDEQIHSINEILSLIRKCD